MINKILHNKISYLMLIFLGFIIGGFMITKGIFAGKVIVPANFFYIYHVFTGDISCYLLFFIFTDDDTSKNDFFKDIFLKIVLLAMIGFFLNLGFNLSIIPFLIIFFIAINITFSLDSRLSFSVSLILLLYLVYYIWIGDKVFAEKLSIYLYYFLVIGLGLELFHTFLETPKIKNIIK